MELNIGNKIKELRKQQNITQEKLAAYLNISYQAISKWENGTAYPDITLVPRIANFFNVSTDTLLGMKSKCDDNELEKSQIVYKDNLSKGKIFDNIILCRKIINEYPRNYQWMLKLAQMLSQYQATDEQLLYSKQHHFHDEAIEICERILEDCTIDTVRHEAIWVLCTLYPTKNMHKTALALAHQMPGISMSKELLLEQIYTEEELIKQKQNNILHLIDLCGNSLAALAFNRQVNMKISYQEKIQFIEASNALYKTIFINDEDSLFFCCRLSWNYRRLAELWCAIGNKEKTMENLLLAEKSAIAYDNAEASGIQKYKSPFVNRCEYNPKDTLKTLECSEVSMLYYRTTESVFNSIRNLPEFIELQKRLTSAEK